MVHIQEWFRAPYESWLPLRQPFLADGASEVDRKTLRLSFQLIIAGMTQRVLLMISADDSLL